MVIMSISEMKHTTQLTSVMIAEFDIYTQFLALRFGYHYTIYRNHYHFNYFIVRLWYILFRRFWQRILIK